MKDEVLEYLARAMSAEREDDFERRLFTDASFIDEASRGLALLDGLRAMSALGPPVPVVTEDALAEVGRRAQVTLHESIDGRVLADIEAQDFVAVRMSADLGGARRIDVLFCTAEGVPYFRVHEAPFTPTGLVILCSAHVARQTPVLFIRVEDERGATRAEVRIENRAPSAQHRP